MRKITLLIALILCVSMVSAWEWDNVKDYDSDKKEITITNALGLGETIAKYKLTYNTDQCLTKCSAEGIAILNNKGKLFTDMEFKNRHNGYKELSYKIELGTPVINKYNESIYENKCRSIERVNGTEEICENKLKEIVQKEREIIEWKEYKGESLNEGTYHWKLKGDKEIGESIDWIGSAFGETFTEWAWWDTDWTYKKAITMTNNESVEKTNNPVRVYVDFDAGRVTNCTKELRLTECSLNNSADCAGGSETEITSYVQLEIDNAGDCVGAYINFLADAPSGNGQYKTYWVYYDNSGASTPSYNNQIYALDNFETGSDINWTIWKGVKHTTMTTSITNDRAKFTGVESDNALAGIYPPKPVTGDFVMSGLGKAVHTTGFDIALGYQDNINGSERNNEMTWGNLQGIDWRFQKEENENSVAGVPSDDGTAFHRLTLEGNSTHYGLYWNGTYQDGGTTFPRTYDGNYTIFGHMAGGDGCEAEWDDIIIYEGEYNDALDYNFFNASLKSTVGSEEENNNLPTVPTLNAPENQTKIHLSLPTVPLNWSNSTDADNEPIIYNVEVFSDEARTTKVYSSYNITETTNTTGATTSSLSKGTYYWRVSAGDGAGNSSWSPAWNFTIYNALPSVTLQSPSNNTNSTSTAQTLTYQVLDSDSTISNCSLIINNEINASDNTITESVDQTFSINFISGSYLWNVQCEDSEGEKANSSQYNITIDVTAPTVTLVMETIELYTVDLNYSIVESNLDTCWYSLNNGVTNTTLASCANTTLTIGEASYFLYLWANDTSGNQGSDTKNFTYVSYGFNYDNNTIEQDTFNTSFNIYKGKGVEIDSINMTYNNTLQTSFSTIFEGDNVTYYKGLTTPISYFNTTNITVFWNTTLTYGSEIQNLNTIKTNNSVYRMAIANCSSSHTNTQTINISIYDEISNTIINSTLENITLAHTYTVKPSAGSGFSRSFSFSNLLNYTEQASKQLCIYPSWANYSANYDIQYDGESYSQRTYSALDSFLNNITFNLTLYLLSAGSEENVTITVIDQNSDAIENMTVKAYKEDLGAGTKTLVETETTDFNGKVYMGLVTADTKYTFEFILDGELKDTKTGVTVPASNELDFQIILGVERTEDLLNQLLSGIDSSITWDNSTRIATFTWEDSGSLKTEACLQLVDLNFTSNLTTSTNCSTTQSSYVSLSIIASSTGVWEAKGYVIAEEDGNKYILEQLMIDLRTAADKFRFGELGIVLAFILILGIALVGAATGSPTITLILVGVSLIPIFVLQLLPILWTSTIGIVTLFFILAMVRRGRG